MTPFVHDRKKSVDLKPWLHRMVIGFAAWTVICHVVVFNHGNLYQLGGLFSIALAGWAFYLAKHKAKPSARPVAGRGNREDVVNALAWHGALGMAVVLVLTLNRPDADDAFYVNMAAAVADHPAASLLCRDTMHYLTDAPILLPFYRVHSLELLAALCAWITGIPAIGFLHLVFPPLAAVLALLAYRSLFMRFSPRCWGWATLAACLFLCANGDGHASYGNLSWVRLHQGKGILATAMVPIVIDATLCFAGAPSAKRFLYLAAAQIAAVGMSGSALFVAPLMSLLAAMACLSGEGMPGSRTRAWAGVMASCVYPLLLAAIVHNGFALPENVRSTLPSGLVPDSLRYVFGSGPFAYACAGIMGCACFLPRSRIGRRLAVICSLFAVLVASNPWLAPVVATRFLGPEIYWRLYWLIPLPLFAGLFFCIPLDRPQIKTAKWIGFAIYSVALFLFLAGLPRQRIFDAGNQVRMGRPGLKVPAFYGDIRAINARLDPTDSILMPVDLSPWLPTLQHAARPVLARPAYAYLYPSGQRAAILGAQAFVSNGPAGAGMGATLDKLVESMKIDAVCFSKANERASDIQAILERHGYRRVANPGTFSYELYVLVAASRQGAIGSVDGKGKAT